MRVNRPARHQRAVPDDDRRGARVVADATDVQGATADHQPVERELAVPAQLNPECVALRDALRYLNDRTLAVGGAELKLYAGGHHEAQLLFVQAAVGDLDDDVLAVAGCRGG